MFKQLANFKNANKKTKIKFFTWMSIAIVSIICLIIICAFLVISYNDTYQYVYDHFKPKTGINFDDHLPSYYHDFILNKGVQTYGQLFEAIGHDSFTWFYITHLHPLSLIPYILMPIFVIIALVSSITFFFIYRNIFPPIKKDKKDKKNRKQKKGVK